MSRILILDNQTHRREKLRRYLREAGYEATASETARHIDQVGLSGIDLLLVNFHPDAERTWDIYFLARQLRPDLPVVVYAENSYQAFRSLKQVADSVCKRDTEGGCESGRCIRRSSPAYKASTPSGFQE